MTITADQHGLWHWSHGSIGAVFSSAVGDYGVSTGPYAACNVGLHGQDDPGHVLANRRSIMRLGEIPATRVVQARQVHGASVARTDRDTDKLVDWTLGVAPEIDADAIVVSGESTAAAILVADCMPVVLAGRRSVAVVHAGWRSLAGGVLEAAAAELVVAGDVLVAAVIGPALGVCCFEVGPEVALEFPEDVLDHDRGERPFLNARLSAHRRIGALGCPLVEHIDICTKCHLECFSHRRENGITGRQAVIAWYGPQRPLG